MWITFFEKREASRDAVPIQVRLGGKNSRFFNCEGCGRRSWEEGRTALDGPQTLSTLLLSFLSRQ